MCVYSVFVLSMCLGRGLATSRSPVQGVLPILNRYHEAEKWPGPTRAVEPLKMYRHISDVSSRDSSVGIATSYGMDDL
jgi:hypothetical protein